MATTIDLTKATPLMAVVGVTDLAVEQLRSVYSSASTAQADLEARLAKAQSDLQKAVGDVDVASLPSVAVARALQAAGRAEQTYEELAQRGSTLVGRIRGQRATQELVEQGRSTVSRTRAAVTTVRRGAEDTTTAAKGTVTTGRRQAEEVAEETGARARGAAKATRTSAKRTTTTARKRTTAGRSATKGAATSARKTASKAATAATDAAEKVGD